MYTNRICTTLAILSLTSGVARAQESTLAGEAQTLNTLGDHLESINLLQRANFEPESGPYDLSRTSIPLELVCDESRMYLKAHTIVPADAADICQSAAEQVVSDLTEQTVNDMAVAFPEVLIDLLSAGGYQVRVSDGRIVCPYPAENENQMVADVERAFRSGRALYQSLETAKVDLESLETSEDGARISYRTFRFMNELARISLYHISLVIEATEGERTAISPGGEAIRVPASTASDRRNAARLSEILVGYTRGDEFNDALRITREITKDDPNLTTEILTPLEELQENVLDAYLKTRSYDR